MEHYNNREGADSHITQTVIQATPLVQLPSDSGVGHLRSLPVTMTASVVNRPQVTGADIQPGPASLMSVVSSDTTTAQATFEVTNLELQDVK